MFNDDFCVSSVSSTEVAVAQEGSPPVAGEEVLAADERPAVGALLREISKGTCNTEQLDAASRQECVLQLSLDGFSNDEIACILRISERTVTRDRKAARKAHALRPDCQLGDELLGEFQGYVLSSIRRLTRLCNDPTAPPAVRVRADEAIGRIYQRFTEQVRRFAYAKDGAERLANQQMDQIEEVKLPENATDDDRLRLQLARLAAMSSIRRW